MSVRSSILNRASGFGGVDYAALIAAAETKAEKVSITAKWILKEFDDYYSESRKIPYAIKEAFERRDPNTTIRLSRKRLTYYDDSVNEFGPRLKSTFPSLASDEQLSKDIEQEYLPMIQGQYEADLAFAYLHSVMRKINQGEWKPVGYSFGDHLKKIDRSTEVCSVLPVNDEVVPRIIVEILNIPNFSRHYRAIDEDARLIVERINKILVEGGYQTDAVQSIAMIKAGFFRNRGAYLVGRMVLQDGQAIPLVIALLNDEDGIYVDAVLHTETDTHNLFSSTWAIFHVNNNYYHEISEFLHSIMPHRPLGLHYSTIGFHHIGKVEVMNELKRELDTSQEVFEISVGYPGTVAIGFAGPSSSFNLKVIRDKPTAQYKWGEFQGVAAVLDKYRRVHEIDRTGSMMDNVIFYNIRLRKDRFAPSLLRELLTEAGKTVVLHGSFVIFKHLIVQLKIIPLTEFLKDAPLEDAETAIINLGYSIKNNMAADIFNKDLDARNYGVSVFLKIFLFDYDALERLTEVKIRSNEDRIDGEEDVPDWYFEDGVVFLPEEAEEGLMLDSRPLRRLFRKYHGDLLTTEYWERIQNDLRSDKVPHIHTYHEDRRLDRSRDDQ